MKCVWLVLMASLACAQQSPLLGDKEAGELATRMEQLVESTAVVSPGLIRAAEPVTQNAQMTLAALLQSPRNPALTERFINQLKAYLALADSVPRPYPFPAAADRQYAELREGVERLQQHFEALLIAETTAEQGRAADPNNLGRYADANTKLLPDGKIPRVVFLGDSITDSWRLNEYFTGRDFINRGIAGQTTSQMLGRFRQDVLTLNPKIVVILGGMNDLANGTSANQIEDNLAMMGDLAKAHGIKVVLASLTPAKSAPRDSVKAINSWLQALCLSGGFTWMDYYAVTADPMGKWQPDLSDDGSNPNAKGYRVMSPLVIAAIDRILSPPQQVPAEKRRFHLPGR